MGGKALKIQTRRYSKEEYLRVRREVLAYFLPHVYCVTVREAPEKESFGDLDVLYVRDLNVDLQELARIFLKSREFVCNGDVMSCDYNDFQIDFIACKDIDDLNMRMAYYSFGDAGYILGLLCHSHGVKFGQQGLWVQFKDNLKSIRLSNSPSEIFAYLDIDYDRWLRGFDTLQELFDIIVSSKRFSAKYFKNLSKNRIQDRRDRHMFRAFMDYALTFSDEEAREPISQDDAIDHFGKRQEYNKLLQEHQDFCVRREKFNGNWVRELTSLSGKNLGEFIRDFKASKRDFESYVDETSKEQIELDILSFVKEN